MNDASADGRRVLCLTDDGTASALDERLPARLDDRLAFAVEATSTDGLRDDYTQATRESADEAGDDTTIRDVIDGTDGPSRVLPASDVAGVVIDADPSFALRTTLSDLDVPVVVYDDVAPGDVPSVATDYVRPADGGVGRLAERVRWHSSRDASGPDEPDAHEKVAQLHDIATRLVTCRQPRDVYQLVVSAAERVLEFDICGVDAVIDGVLVPRAVSAGMADVGYERASVDEQSLAGVAHRTGESSVVSDIRTAENANPVDDEYRSVLTVPIGNDAVFQAGSRDVDAFDDADRELAELLAAHAEGALHRIRSEAAIRARRKTIERLHEIVARMVACESESDVYDLLVDAAERVLQFSVCVVIVDDPDRGYLTVRAASEADLAPPLGDSFGYDQGVAGKTFRTGRAIRVDDVPNHAAADPHDERYAACVSVPMGDLGVVQAISTEPYAFDDNDLELAELLASQAGVAITRLRAEHKLRTEHDRLRALFEHIPDPAVSYAFEDDRPVVRDVNTAFETVFGYRAADVIGESVDEYIVPDSRQENATEINQRFQAGDAFQREVRRRTADGSARDFLLQVVPVELDAGNVAGYSIYTDITARKRRERQLGALHRTTRELLGATDPQEVCEIAVGAARRTLGLRISGVHLARDGQLVPAAASEETVSLFDGALPTYTPEDDRIWAAYRSSSPRVFDTAEQAFVPQDAAIDAVLVQPLADHGVFVSAAEDAAVFDESTVDLAGVLGANLTAALARAERETRLRERERELKRQNERLDEFTSVVSHDLRTPLSVARGHLDLAMERMEGDDDSLQKVADAHERMDALLSDLLELARKGQVVGDSEPVSLRAAAQSAWATVDPPRASLTVADTDAVVADRDRLVQLLENLFKNAVEHGGETVSVTVGCTVHGFYVADDGTGIPEADRDSVFDRGFSTADDGTGFGLAIVAEIANAHGWTITVTESEAGGARFEIDTS